MYSGNAVETTKTVKVLWDLLEFATKHNVDAYASSTQEPGFSVEREEFIRLYPRDETYGARG